MSARTGRRRFSPPAWAVAVTALALAAFVSLGSWQLGRAREKQALLEQFESAGRTTLDATGVDLGRLPRYQHLRLRGRYQPATQVLLDAMPSAEGRAGYRVLTPLLRSDGRGRVLVDRGWVPPGASRESLPELAVGAGEREVSGLLDELPAPGLRLGPAAAPDAAGWPRVLLFPAPADLESALGPGVEPRIVLLDPGQPDGFDRRWRPSPGFGPERHLGYAVQWFAFALLALVLFIALNLRRSTPDDRGSA